MTQVRTPSRCRAPYCRHERDGDDKWCSHHRDVLEKVRRDLAADAQRFRGRIGVKRAPKCCAPGCVNGRVPPARYCVACEDEGWSEEDLA